MTKKIFLLLVLTILFGVFTQYVEGRLERIRVAPDFGCADGRKYGLFHHRDMAACKGAWDGHVGNAPLCSSGWHVCNWNDTDQLSSIGFYRASHIDGCFAVNAAQNEGHCQECNADTNAMAGIGADCPRIDDTVRGTCLRRGRIDATFPTLDSPSTCSYGPWLTGVVCCKEKKKGSEPVITTSPTSSMRVPRGQKVILTCEASGNPVPRITWFKNGYPVTMEELFDDVTIAGDKIVSILSIPGASRHFDGLYLCRAENSNGFAVSYSSDVTSYQETSSLTACKNKRKQVLLHGGTVAACGGRWRGNIRKASEQMCAKGWKVCGVKERTTLHKLPWEEITTLEGCYAYDAATSDNFACTKCNHHRRGNTMAGIGAGCGVIESEGTSCLGTGRIDVWAQGSTNSMTPSQTDARHKRNSCNYRKGITSGVVCCRNKRQQSARKTGVNCPTPCGPHSHCSRKGVCKCDSNYKAIGDLCVQKRDKGKRCSDVNCLNGGHCKKGICICPPGYAGQHCENVAQSQAFFRNPNLSKPPRR